MMAGDPKRFAVEFEADTPVDKQWKFGRMRFWIGGDEIGDYQSGATLCVVRAQLGERLQHAGQRNVPELWYQSATYVMSRVYGLLYEELGQSDQEVARAERTYRRLFVLPVGEGFDGFRALLLESNHSARLLWSRSESSSPVFEVSLQSGEYDSVIRQVLGALDSL